MLDSIANGVPDLLLRLDRLSIYITFYQYLYDSDGVEAQKELVLSIDLGIFRPGATLEWWSLKLA